MRKVFKRAIYIYFFMIVICCISYYYMNNITYNNVKIVPVEVFNEKILSTNIPEKIIIRNENLGEQVITNKLLINDMLKVIRDICKGNNKNNNTDIDSKIINLNGEIVYSDEVINKFSLNNFFIIDGEYFSNNTYLLNELRNMLLENLYCYDNILDMIANKNNEIKYCNGNNKIMLNENEKEKLIKSMKDFKILSDNKDFLNMDLKEDPKFNLKICLDKNKKELTNNSIFLDVYKDYIIFQYLGDENGKKVYIKGELNEESFK